MSEITQTLSVTVPIPDLHAAIGEDEEIQLNTNMESTPLNDLGIDSLAAIDATGRIKHELRDGTTAGIEFMRDLAMRSTRSLRVASRKSDD